MKRDPIVIHSLALLLGLFMAHATTEAQHIAFWPTCDTLVFRMSCTPPYISAKEFPQPGGIDTIEIAERFYNPIYLGMGPHANTVRRSYFLVPDSDNTLSYSLWYQSQSVDSIHNGVFAIGSSRYVLGPFTITLYMSRNGMVSDSVTVQFFGDVLAGVNDRSTSDLALDLQTYPNPFNASTMITFLLHSRTRVIIEVFSVIGQHIDRIGDSEFEMGSHSIRWDPRILASGNYIIRLTAGSQHAARLVTILR